MARKKPEPLPQGSCGIDERTLARRREMPISRLPDITDRTLNTLDRVGIVYVGDLLERADDLAYVDGFGPSMFFELNDRLAFIGVECPAPASRPQWDYQTLKQKGLTYVTQAQAMAVGKAAHNGRRRNAIKIRRGGEKTVSQYGGVVLYPSPLRDPE